MSSLNKAMIIGRLGQDPEIRTVKNGTKVANMSLATTGRYQDATGEWKENTEWHKVVVFGKKAEVVESYTKKGSLIFIEGSIETNKWTDKNNVDRYTTQIKAYQITLLDSKGDSNGAPASPKSSAPSNDAGDSSKIDLNDFSDDDLPF